MENMLKPPVMFCLIANIITRNTKVFSFFYVELQKVVMNHILKKHSNLSLSMLVY